MPRRDPPVSAAIGNSHSGGDRPFALPARATIDAAGDGNERTINHLR